MLLFGSPESASKAEPMLAGPAKLILALDPSASLIIRAPAAPFPLVTLAAEPGSGLASLGFYIQEAPDPSANMKSHSGYYTV